MGECMLKKQLLILLCCWLLPCFSFAQDCDFSFSAGTQNLWHYPDNYEIRSGRIVDAVKKKELPDIMAFQEAWTWWGKKSIYRDFLEASGYRSFFSPSKRYGKILREGVALASHFQILDTFDTDLPHTMNIAKRKLIAVKYQIQDRAVWVITVHFTPGPFGFLRKWRKEQKRFLMELLNEKFASDPVILLGDFNDTPDSGIFKPLLDSGFVEVKNSEGFTYVLKNPYAKTDRDRRLDYIFFRPEQLTLIQSGFLFREKPISDHYGLWGQFCLN